MTPAAAEPDDNAKLTCSVTTNSHTGNAAVTQAAAFPFIARQLSIELRSAHHYTNASRRGILSSAQSVEIDSKQYPLWSRTS